MMTTLISRSLIGHALIISGGIAVHASYSAHAETVIFSYQGSIYLSGFVGEESGLFVCQAAHAQVAANFMPARRICDVGKGVTPAFLEGSLRLIAPGWEYDFDANMGFGKKRALKLPVDVSEGSIWTMADYNGDGRGDVVVFSHGSPAGKARIFYGRSDGCYAEPFVFQVEGKDFDATQVRLPFFVNFDEDDDLDLMHMNAKGQVVYYENRNTNSEPLYEAGKILSFEVEKEGFAAGLQAFCPADRNADGRLDLYVVMSDGAIGSVLHQGVDAEGVPKFSPMEVLLARPPTVK